MITSEEVTPGEQPVDTRRARRQQAQTRAGQHSLRLRTWAFLNTAVWVIAALGVLVVSRLLLQAENETIAYAGRIRTVLGSPQPAGAPDWYLIAAGLLVPIVCVSAALLGYLLWMRSCRRRLHKIWPFRSARSRTLRRHMRLTSLHGPCHHPEGCAECERKTNYLSDLLGTKHWRARLDSSAAPSDALAPDQYEEFAAAAFEVLETDILARALATGLAVGFNRSRFIDALTIIAGSFEMHRFVLTELGKRPRLRLLPRVIRNCLASVFLNLFLNRRDVLVVNIAIRKAALGVSVVADLTESASQHLSHLNVHDVDADEFISGGFVASALKNTALAALTVGSTGLHSIAQFIDHFGNDLVQGCLAAGILYYQGAREAADILARDSEHRRSDVFNKGPLDCSLRVGQLVGVILRDQVQALRGAFRERRVEAINGPLSAMRNFFYKRS